MGVGKATTPAMMVDPASGQLQCTKQGVLAAQVHHTQQLGSQQQFTQANPQFDDAFLHHVTAEVGSFAELATGAADAGDAMNGPITEDEVLEAMLDLNNGKAASPHTGVPNELLKYGGRDMARLLMPLFATGVWGRCAAPGLDHRRDPVLLQVWRAMQHGQLPWHHLVGCSQQAVSQGAGQQAGEACRKQRLAAHSTKCLPQRLLHR